VRADVVSDPFEGCSPLPFEGFTQKALGNAEGFDDLFPFDSLLQHHDLDLDVEWRASLSLG